MEEKRQLPEKPENTAYTIEVFKDTTPLVIYLKEADKKTISMAFSKMRKVNENDFDMVEIGELILRKTIIGGDVQEVLSDDKCLISAAMKCYELIEIYDSNIKKH